MFHLRLTVFRIAKPLKEKWCKAIGRDPAECDHEYICSQHFKKTDYFTGNISQRLRLKPDAVPSVNLGKALIGYNICLIKH